MPSVRPLKGGFQRPFGCGTFIRDFLTGSGPHGSPTIDSDLGAPQTDIFNFYKQSLAQVTAMDKATKEVERRSRQKRQPIEPKDISSLYNDYLLRLSAKSKGCTYHSFVNYFGNLKRLGWVKRSGYEEPSAFQDNYPPGPSRIYYRLTQSGRIADDNAWSNPQAALYGYPIAVV